MQGIETHCCVVRSAESQDVFNLPLFEGYLVLDTRGHEAHASRRIASSRAFSLSPEEMRSLRSVSSVFSSPSPAPSTPSSSSSTSTPSAAVPSPTQGAERRNDDRVMWNVLARIMCSVVDYGAPERYSPVVVCGPSRCTCGECCGNVPGRVGSCGYDTVAAFSSWLANTLHQVALQSDKRNLFETLPVHYSGPENNLQELLQETCGRFCALTKEVWILKGGVETFLEQYPLLAESGTEEAEQVPTPHHICPELFIGSRAMNVDAKLLSGLHIKNVVCADDFPAAEIEVGINFLRCQVMDSDAQNMAPLWDSAIPFISEAARRGERVLVLLHGRSRSAAIAIAYLMDTTHMTFTQACEKVVHCCPSVDLSLIYPTQLQQRPQRQHQITHNGE
ncbi:hypothetical protein Pelo_5781 [Pelomyxa schiedti]|nr:hypothetical protein Pelo_5781 [Pelomyxa schiedti]